jgi:hypothetical protein
MIYKRILIFVCLIYTAGFPVCLSAQDSSGTGQEVERSGSSSSGAEIASPIRGERFFEVGVPAMITISSKNPFGFINDMTGMATGKFGQLLAGGDDLRANLFAMPLTVSLRVRDIIKIDLFTGLQMTLNTKVDEDVRDSLDTLIQFADSGGRYGDIQAINGKHGSAKVGLSSFFEIGAGASMRFLGNKLLIRAAPSLYFPIFYAKEGRLDFAATASGTWGEVTANADFSLWTPTSAGDSFSTDGILKSIGEIFRSPGADLSVEGRFAVLRMLEAGAVITHIPVVPATTYYAMKAHGKLALSADWTSGLKDTSTLIFDTAVKEENMLIRPVRFDFFALIKPFETMFLYIKPNIGFSLAQLVEPEIPINFGLEAGVNLPVFFSASLGTGHTDGLWQHTLSLTMDVRFIELTITGALSGPDFLTNGFTAGLGVKMGF